MIRLPPEGSRPSLCSKDPPVGSHSTADMEDRTISEERRGRGRGRTRSWSQAAAAAMLWTATLLLASSPQLIHAEHVEELSSSSSSSSSWHRQQQQQQQQQKQQQQQQQQRQTQSSSTTPENLLQYYDSPQLHWKIQLPDGYTLQQDNAIVPSPFDETLVYATTQEGVLMVLSANDGSFQRIVQPTPPRLTLENGVYQKWSTTCRSGLVFVQLSSSNTNSDGDGDSDGSLMVVFAVRDEPPPGSELAPKTRVVAVSIPDHEELWTSAGLPGQNIGSPVLYQTRNQQTYIGLTHNSWLVKGLDNSTIQTGRITLLDASRGGHVLWMESEWSRDDGDTPKGYGPPTVASHPLRGKYDGGQDNTNDVVVWASTDEEGQGSLGHTFALQLPMAFIGTDTEKSNLASRVLKKVRWNTLARPVLSRNGTDMFVGVSGDQLRGWVGGTDFDSPANWASDLSRADGESSSSSLLAAIPVAPTLSQDEKRLFSTTSSTDVHCVETHTGKKMWDVQGTSPFLAEAQASPDNQRVYFIQSIDGRVFCHEQITGKLLWVAGCDTFEEDCSNSVKAHFSLSSSGQYLYYADVRGRVIALKLGDLRLTWKAPTAAPVSAGPGVLDSLDWSTAPKTTNNIDEEPSRAGPSVGGTISVVVLGILVAAASAVYVMVTKKGKTNIRSLETASTSLDESNQELCMDTILENELDGPDPYEDSMISEHRMQLSRPGELDVWYEEGSPTADKGGHFPSDRISVLLGTSNRIAPLREDFSLGAAVFV